MDICKPINLLNKKWGDKNPPQTTQLNKKMKKRRNRKYRPLTIITRRQVKGEEEGKILLEIWERRKNYWVNTSIYLLNPDTAL